MKKKLLVFIVFLVTFVLSACATRTYKVTFDIYSGESESQVVKSGETIEDFTPTLEGYTFLGWLYEDEIFDVTTPITNNITLTASWKANDVTITYMLGSSSINYVTTTAGSILREPNIESFNLSSDELFFGWFTDETYTIEYTFNTSITKDITIYGKVIKNSDYTPTLIVSFNSTGANVKLDDITVKRLEKIENLPQVTRDGYTFLGWYYEDKLVTSDTVIEMTENFTLIAKWEKVEVTYEISFNSNEGSSVSNITVKEGEEVTLPTPTRQNCTFAGWYNGNTLMDNTFTYNYTDSLSLKAKWVSTLTSISVNGSSLNYKSSSVAVMTPTTYCERIEEFRACWVTSYVGDFSPSTDKNTMKANLTAVLDKMESYNMNAIVFHLRTTNNAFYQTKLAPISSSYGTYESFNTWDYLEWFIDECHKRGIEFHAWLNPYRLSSSGYSDLTLQEIANKWADYPENPASNPDNILKTSAGGAILNPAKEEVQNYVVKVCKELAENYKIDAIHFDDYFYASLSDGSITSEADQTDYTTYIKNNPSCGYSQSSTTDKANWRRDNVTSMISKIHTMLTEFNTTNTEGRYVQFGISPTGIYKNGDGKVSYDENGNAITTGSKTSGQEHYASYLYCDSLKWANEGLIDYLCPQTYWQFSHSVAGFADVVNWWQQAMKNNKCNLYLGIGIYFSFNSKMGSWYTDSNELINQINYASQFDSVKGFCIFSYKQILAVEAEGTVQHDSLLKLKTSYWKNYVSPVKYSI